ncbi:MAG: polyamine aminopropyltransferase [Phycisphaerales bacterium]|nr:polyamine aminopropyltransferase [Phycisphaerales bacterium]MCB9856475.1 polyamine aminopropyltransferase [Phycisphaerales bacterium]MCB9863956.1 polyamine aminopropyltransferase [Phycisphaerales bacterium]
MTDEPPHDEERTQAGRILLVGAIFSAAGCGIVYELVAGTLSSYLLGDSVTQFSLVIGLFLTSMGIGSFLSRYLKRDLIAWFVAGQIAVGIVGGFAALIGFAAFAYTELYQPILFGLVVVIGTLVGLEIPLVVRILRDLSSLRGTLANVLSADYLGALAASVLFPFALLPYLGLVSAGMLTGLVNVAVGGFVLWRFHKTIRRWTTGLSVATAIASLLLVAGIAYSTQTVSMMESRLYQDEIIYSKSTPYQRIVITRWREDLRLYLNGHLQFAAVDEYRYHEALVLPAMEAAARHERVLILGGGDGLAARQVLKYDGVKRIDLVDLDSEVTNIFKTWQILTRVNGNTLNDPRVHIHNTDAFGFLQNTTDLYDVILIDLPDPSAAGLGKLYSRTFYGLVGRHLADGGAMTCQSTSPFRSRSAFWCIAHTAGAARWGPENTTKLEVRPYHTLVPTFGTWGFILCGTSLPPTDLLKISVDSQYFTSATLPGSFVFPPDMSEIETPISDLNDPEVVKLYHSGYHKYLD